MRALLASDNRRYSLWTRLLSTVVIFFFLGQVFLSTLPLFFGDIKSGLTIFKIIGFLIYKGPPTVAEDWFVVVALIIILIVSFYLSPMVYYRIDRIF